MPNSVPTQHGSEQAKRKLRKNALQKPFVGRNITPYAHNINAITLLAHDAPATICRWHDARRVVGHRGKRGHVITTLNEANGGFADAHGGGGLLRWIIRSHKHNMVLRIHHILPHPASCKLSAIRCAALPSPKGWPCVQRG